MNGIGIRMGRLSVVNLATIHVFIGGLSGAKRR
jgi:hypothetical protein